MTGERNFEVAGKSTFTRRNEPGHDAAFRSLTSSKYCQGVAARSEGLKLRQNCRPLFRRGSHEIRSQGGEEEPWNVSLIERILRS